jgi:hypothetical protein
MRSISLLGTLLSSPATTLIAALTAAFISPPAVGSETALMPERNCAAGASGWNARVLPTSATPYLAP